MKNNLKEIKTTILGTIIFLIGVLYFALPYFHVHELWEPSALHAGMIAGAGVLLLLAPDSILDFAKKKLDKKANE
jgi:hypothetical protein